MMMLPMVTKIVTPGLSNAPWLKLTRRIGTGINLHAAPVKMAKSITG